MSVMLTENSPRNSAEQLADEQNLDRGRKDERENRDRHHNHGAEIGPLRPEARLTVAIDTQADDLLRE
jgi:hypothetical protein